MWKLVCMVVLVACSSPSKPKDKPPTGGPNLAMTPEQFCAEIETGPAAYLAKCSDADKQLQATTEISHGANGADQCKARMKSVATKRISFDAKRAADCVAEWKARIAAAPRERDLGPACVGVITGLVAVDGACDDNYECAGAGRCDGNKCIAAPDEEGEACTGGILPTFEADHSGCDKGLVCAAGGRRTSCRKPIAIGEDCSGMKDPCANGGACIDKKCVAKPPIVDVGGTCATVEGGEITQLLPCANDAYCPLRGMKDKASCVAKKAKGEACTENDECRGRCSKDTSQCESVCGSG